MNFPTVALSEIACPVTRPVSVLPGISYRTIGVKWWGEGAYERETIDGSQTAAKTLSLVQEGDLIINKIWVRHGSTAITSKAVDGCAASGEFPTFELDCTKVFPRWIHWLTKSFDFWSKCDALSHGTSGKNRIKPELFLTIQIPLPPLSEQCRIVARIEELVARIEEARGLRQEVGEEVESLVSSALAKFITDEVSRTCKLDDVCLQVTDGEHATPPRIPKNEQSIPLVTAKNVRDGYLDLSTTDFVSKYTAERCWQRCHPQYDDILMVCVGATTGRVCRLVNPPNMVIVRSVAMLRPNKDVLDPKFLEYALESSYCQNQIWSNVKQAAQPGLYIHRMKQLTIPVPSLDEQRRIVNHLDNLQTRLAFLKQLQSETSAELDALLPSILDKAFKGEL